ncbi:elongation factor 4 [candidate division TA06 bacterium]|nr:elongation factor 4 [candidate division TA06 bacterium]
MLNIRNFSIIAHIDHGKSTLADRLLEFTHTLAPNEMREQVLDSMDLEREHGVTIKAHHIRMNYRAKDGKDYILNLIDTPGHVDFSYEVSRSLAACEGVILLVDGSQGVEAQTVAHLQEAKKQNLTILPAINKVDLKNVDVEGTRHQIIELMSSMSLTNQLTDPQTILQVSAKKGIGIEEVLEAIVHQIPPPSGDPKGPLKALIFDSVFDRFRGVILHLRVYDGEVKTGMEIELFSSEKRYEVIEVGHFRMGHLSSPLLHTGEVGYLVCGMRDLQEARVGETVVESKKRPLVPLPGYEEAKPMVYMGLYPAQGEEVENLEKALQRLQLNDSALVYQSESSPALGYGFRCGFLGHFHSEIVQERLEREFGLTLIATLPSVRYRVLKRDGSILEIENPSQLPPLKEVLGLEEPFVLVEILSPGDSIGNVLGLCHERRGVQREIRNLNQTRVVLSFELPLCEVIVDFHDRLKSVTRGYGSFDYHWLGYRPADLVRLDILINGVMVDALSTILHKEKAYHWGQQLTKTLRKSIPRQAFEVVIQAAIGKKVISATRIAPFRKDVTAKCYGGDITRKRKLWDKQKVGKKRMKKIGRVEIPQEAFLAALKME